MRELGRLSEQRGRKDAVKNGPKRGGSVWLVFASPSAVSGSRPAPSVELAEFVCRSRAGQATLEPVLLPMNFFFGSKSYSVAFLIQQAISAVGELSWLDFYRHFLR